MAGGACATADAAFGASRWRRKFDIVIETK